MFEKFIAALGLKRNQTEEITEVINMYDAMLAHAAWKKRLFEYLEGTSKEDLQPGNIGVDHKCLLGKWIHKEGKAEFGDDPTFMKLVDEHAKFHQQAAKVVEAQMVGDTERALDILKGSFEEQSRRTVNCLTRLNALLEARKQQT